MALSIHLIRAIVSSNSISLQFDLSEICQDRFFYLSQFDQSTLKSDIHNQLKRNVLITKVSASQM